MKKKTKLEVIRQIIHDIASLFTIIPLILAGATSINDYFIEELKHVNEEVHINQVKILYLPD